MLAQTTMYQQTLKLLISTGKMQDFQNWSLRFVVMMQTMGLHKSLLGIKEQTNGTAPLAKSVSNDQKKNYKVLKDAYEKDIAEKQKLRRKEIMCGANWC